MLLLFFGPSIVGTHQDEARARPPTGFGSKAANDVAAFGNIAGLRQPSFFTGGLTTREKNIRSRSTAASFSPRHPTVALAAAVGGC